MFGLFTGVAVILVGLIVWHSHRENAGERPDYSRPDRDENRFGLLLHLRQDAKLIVYLLAGVIVMLGIVADRLH